MAHPSGIPRVPFKGRLLATPADIRPSQGARKLMGEKLKVFGAEISKML
jgi:hypothetical protein